MAWKPDNISVANIKANFTPVTFNYLTKVGLQCIFRMSHLTKVSSRGNKYQKSSPKWQSDSIYL